MSGYRTNLMPAKRRMELAAKFAAQDATGGVLGAPPAAAPRRGDCSYCGHTYQILNSGNVVVHEEWRVRPKRLVNGEVRGEEYRTDVTCAGTGLPPGPDVQRYPWGRAA